MFHTLKRSCLTRGHTSNSNRWHLLAAVWLLRIQALESDCLHGGFQVNEGTAVFSSLHTMQETIHSEQPNVTRIGWFC